MPPALELQGLRKSFDRVAVDGLDLQVRAGEVFALLGPNGAGKTTTLRMAAGLLRPDAGSIRVCGIDALADPVGAKQVAAWLPDEPLLYDKLTPLEYMEFVAGLWAVPPGLAVQRAEDLLRTRVAGGTGIGLTTHILDVAERIADRIGIIARGRLLEVSTFEELRGRHPGHDTLEGLFLALVSQPV